MTVHYQVLGRYQGRLAERAYFVSDIPTARRVAVQDGAQAVYRIRQVRQNWLTQQFLGREYAMLLLRAVQFQVDAGVPPVKAVQATIDSETDPRKRARLQGAVDAIARGASLADVLQATGLYDATVHSILVAGERIGGVRAVASALEYLEARQASWKTYGFVASVLSMELSTALSVPPTIQEYAIPWIRENLPKTSPEELAQHVQQLDAIALHNQIWMWFSFGVLAVVFLLVLAWISHPRYKDWLTQKVLMRLPLLGDWYAHEALSRSCKVFASMLTAGVRMDDAIQTILRATKNGVARRFWATTSSALNAGAVPGTAFAAAGVLRRDETLVLKSARGNAQLARAFAAIAAERLWRQKALSTRIFRMSVVVMMVYIAITLLIGLKLFGLFNAGLEMSMNSMTKGI